MPLLNIKSFSLITQKSFFLQLLQTGHHKSSLRIQGNLEPLSYRTPVCLSPSHYPLWILKRYIPISSSPMLSPVEWVMHTNYLPAILLCAKPKKEFYNNIMIQEMKPSSFLFRKASSCNKKSSLKNSLVIMHRS
ncbi:Uncharacterised protein [Chlamydia trachomatis]|nr:Uncharacterised protein [Chlamydia trachomatis]